MRILNNFAYASGFTLNQKGLKPVNTTLNAILYYSINDKIYSIKSKGNKITHSELEETFDITNLKKDNSKLKEKENILFYTQITNYSLYAYNSLQFSDETKEANACWLNGIFHKNDGYQTPILISPWRYNGNIDINKEIELAKERLISLFVSDEDFRKINEKQKAKNLMYLLEKISKLDTKSMYDFFRNVKESNIAASFETKYKIRSISLLRKTENNGLKDILSSLKHVVQNINNFVIQEKSLLERAVKINHQIINDIREELNDQNWIPNDTDLKYILDSLNEIPEIQESVQEIKKSIPDIDLLNTTQFMRVVLIACYTKKWKEYLDSRYSEFKNNSYRDRLIDYLVYKSISIVNEKTYPSYRIFFQTDYFLDFIEDTNKISEILTRSNEVIKKITGDNSHVTLKIRQTINFIKYNEKYKYLNIEDDDNKENNKSNKYDYKVSFEKYNERLKKISEFDSSPSKIIEFLPPPIFETDVEFIQTDKEKSYLSQLSSGEQQELNTTSYVIYHLRNIDSIKDEKLVRYKYINLIFEEIELYFHPEYQRRYIKRLIEQIGKVQLNSIESINMCFVTHSPFILSDIPNCNIMYLKEGKQINDKITVAPFGANIHDILHQSFFLENGFIGNFAQNKIKVILDEINRIIENNKDKNDKDKEFLLKENYDKFITTIKLIGEPLIRTKLLMMIEEVYNDKTEILKDEIAILENEVNQKKKRLNNK
jgi:hypothetical protein